MTVEDERTTADRERQKERDERGEGTGKSGRGAMQYVEGEDLEKLSIDELRARAKELGAKNVDSLNKDQLMHQIRDYRR